MKPRERLMLDYLDAWNRRDADAIAAFFAEDAVDEDQGAGTVVRGRDQIRARRPRARRLSGPALRARPHRPRR
jgi:ketosteroid isomerase-like protein